MVWCAATDVKPMRKNATNSNGSVWLAMAIVSSANPDQAKDATSIMQRKDPYRSVRAPARGETNSDTCATSCTFNSRDV
eukprot:scaffold161_cov172-Amphora_coffeaeformis.AAC.5